MMEEAKHLWELPITNNLVDLTSKSNGKFDDDYIKQKPILQQDEKKIDIVPQTCCIKIEVESEAHSEHENLLKKEVDCAQVSQIDIPTNLPKLENITSDIDTELQTCNIKLESSVEDFFDCGNHHLKKEVDYAQMSVNDITGVNVFCNGSVAEFKKNKEEENTTACSSNGAMHSQISSLNVKSQCELCGAEFTQARSLMVHRSVYHGQDQQTSLPQDSNVKKEKELGIDHFNDVNCINSRLHKTVIYSKTKSSHICSVCNKTFNHLVILKSLQGINTGQKIYKCIECKIDLSSKLEGYRGMHSKNKPETSTDFKKSKNHANSIQINQHISKEVKHYKCTECNMIFTQISMLKHKCIHSSEKQINCTNNDKAIRKSGGNKSNQSIHTGEKHFKCNDCGKAFKHFYILKAHLTIHTGDKPYKCKDCDKAFRHSSYLKRHQNIHTGEKSFMCKDCGKAFNQSSDLKRHQNIHKGIKPYKCSTCGKAFAQFSHLKLHIRIHTGEKPYRCTDCGKAFTYSSYLKKHKNINTREKSLCKVCCKSFNQPCHLKIHRNVHKGIKPYKCNACGKAFTQLGELKKHIRIHTGEKPYRCTDCGKAFNQSSTLKTHQNIHKGIKPYKCNTCGKAFTSFVQLKVHIRIHTGEKPYRCTVCGKAFNQSCTLKTHQNIHKGIKPYKCYTCGKAFSQSNALKLHIIRFHTPEGIPEVVLSVINNTWKFSA